MKRVVILETQHKHYRDSFVNQLASTLRERRVELVVGYSSGDHDTVELPSTLGVNLDVHTWHGLVFQNAWRLVRDADLVVVSQENRLLFNYLLIALSQLGVKRLAYWGHGFNHQAEQTGVSEWLKRALLTRADWWFAYTSKVGRYLEAHGVRPDRITVVHNTIDVEVMRADIAATDMGAVRAALGIAREARVGIYCGAVTAAKQIGFLVDAAAEIRRLVPTFELVVVGDGPERPMLEAIARYRPFIHVVGPAFGIDRARYFALAEACLIPAQVGLVIVDAFAAGLPLITTDAPGHGPELEYLSTETGFVTPNEIDAYAAAVARVLLDPQRLAGMRAAARARGLELPLARMVGHFADGIRRCLERP
jgi:glycosyltransferase involved in cell wall biosynthesis